MATDNLGHKKEKSKKEITQAEMMGSAQYSSSIGRLFSHPSL
jgi:hypothetical protein